MTTGIRNNADAAGNDAVQQSSVKKIVPKTPEQFTYDFDGNVLSDGRWNYTWDGENRLVKVESISTVPTTEKKQILFVYDSQSRRVSKKVNTWNGTAWVLQDSRRFLYDQFNLLAELNDSATVMNSYAWGTDLSGSMYGAGGVGGLLICSSTSNNYPAFDANGNILGYVNQSGSVTAQFEYGPFGESQSERQPNLAGSQNRMAQGSTGVQPNSGVEGEFATFRSSGTPPCNFGFSTKYRDSETGLNYYGYRYYSSGLGRWLGRDPIGERGGLNLYGMVRNNPIRWIDVNGLTTYTFDKNTCTLNVRLTWSVSFSNQVPFAPWNSTSEAEWKNKAKTVVENYFSNIPFICFPSGGIKCCTCPSGVTVKFNLDYVTAGADYAVTVVPDPAHGSSVYRPDNTGDFDIDDVNSQYKGKGQNQTPIVHETGHMLDLDHPGGNSNDTSAYDKDTPSLMGRGMILRLPDFDKAFCKHISAGSPCDPWSGK